MRQRLQAPTASLAFSSPATYLRNKSCVLKTSRRISWPRGSRTVFGDRLVAVQVTVVTHPISPSHTTAAVRATTSRENFWCALTFCVGRLTAQARTMVYTSRFAVAEARFECVALRRIEVGSCPVIRSKLQTIARSAISPFKGDVVARHEGKESR